MRMRGYLTLELIVALALGSLLLSLATPSVMGMAHTYSRLKQEQRDISSELRLRELLKAASAALDKHRFWLLPRTQKILTYSDGTLNPIMFTQTSSAPQQDSSFLTVLNLDTTQVLAVNQVALQSAQLIGDACSIVQTRVQSSERAHFVALGATSFAELQGEVSRQSSYCLRFSLRKGKSMLPQRFHADTMLKPHILIPIESLYTLYVDKRKQLRFLAHRGGENIENQPMLTGIESADFTISLTPDLLVQIEGSLHLPSSNELRFGITNRLARSEAENFILNSQ